MDAIEKPDVNAVWLRNAVLCADCEVISDSQHDTCNICGSHALLNLSRILGTLGMQRAYMVELRAERATLLPVKRLPHRNARQAAA
jgi:hypothetical protein